METAKEEDVDFGRALRINAKELKNIDSNNSQLEQFCRLSKEVELLVIMHVIFLCE